MTSQEQINQWIAGFEADGEQAVRDSLNFRGDVVTGGRERIDAARKWLRERAKAREVEGIERRRYERVTLFYVQRTFWAAVVGAFLAAAAIVVAVLHL